MCCLEIDSYSATFGDLEFKEGLPADVSKQIRKYDKLFETRDRRILYFVTLCLIANAFTVLFVLGGMETDTYINKIIVCDAIFLMGFALLISIVRIWMFKYLMLQPIIALWRQFAGQTLDKWMFFFFCFFGFCAIILMVAVVSVLTTGNINTGVGLALLDCCLYLLALTFYRLHISVYIHHAKTTEISQVYNNIV
jgi:hypothetical protein